MKLAMKAAEGFGNGETGASWETPVTIIVHGVIIAGYVISRKKYMKSVTDGMKNATLSGSGGENNRKLWGTVVSHALP
jgi:hypothetical protein